MQLAKKKSVTPFDRKGGWKVLVPACPHCMEDRYKDVENSENRSVASHRSNKSSRSVRSSRSVKSPSRSIKSSSRGSNKKKAVPKCPFDEKGYCHVHAHIRLEKDHHGEEGTPPVLLKVEEEQNQKILKIMV